MEQAPAVDQQVQKPKDTLKTFKFISKFNEQNYKITINLTNKIEIYCNEENNNKQQYFNKYSKENIENLHKYFEGGTLEEIYEGIVDFIPNSRIEKNTNLICLKIPIRYFGKTKDISLELNQIQKDKLPIINRVQYLEDMVEKLLEKNNFLKDKISKLSEKINKKIIFYKEKKSLKLDSGICSVIVLSNKDIAIGKRNGELPKILKMVCH